MGAVVGQTQTDNGRALAARVQLAVLLRLGRIVTLAGPTCAPATGASRRGGCLLLGLHLRRAGGRRVGRRHILLVRHVFQISVRTHALLRSTFLVLAQRYKPAYVASLWPTARTRFVHRIVTVETACSLIWLGTVSLKFRPLTIHRVPLVVLMLVVGAVAVVVMVVTHC